MVSVKDILEYFKGLDQLIVIGKANVDLKISAPKDIRDAGEDDITFINKKYEKEFPQLIKDTKSPLVLIDSALFQKTEIKTLPADKCFVVCDDPKLSLIGCLQHFFIPQQKKTQIHPSVSIAENVTLGNRILIGPNVVIEENVSIGDDCTIDACVVIKKGTVIGKKVIIKASSVIGGDGFGYVKDGKRQSYLQLPHFGKVIIEDDVHIGSNTCIDRGSFSDTIIKKGVKIDNLIHIAHNVVIGENTLIVALSLIGGSVEIGENCWLAPAVTVRNRLKIGKNSTIGMGCVVTKDIPEGATVAGVPAVEMEDFIVINNHHKDIINQKKQSSDNP